MYHHIKKLMYTVNVWNPNSRRGNMLLEQFGVAKGEVAAAMQLTSIDEPKVGGKSRAERYSVGAF